MAGLSKKNSSEEGNIELNISTSAIFEKNDCFSINNFLLRDKKGASTEMEFKRWDELMMLHNQAKIFKDKQFVARHIYEDIKSTSN